MPQVHVATIHKRREDNIYLLKLYLKSQFLSETERNMYDQLNFADITSMICVDHIKDFLHKFIKQSKHKLFIYTITSAKMIERYPIYVYE